MNSADFYVKVNKTVMLPITLYLICLFSIERRKIFSMIINFLKKLCIILYDLWQWQDNMHNAQ